MQRLCLRSVKFGIQIWSDLAPNGTKIGFFKISFSTFWLSVFGIFGNFHENLILKSARIVSFGINLIQYEAKSAIHDSDYNVLFV